MFPARIAIATAMENVQGASNGNCNVFQAKLKLFGKASTSSPSSLRIEEITNQTFEVLHAGESAISVNEQVIVGQTIDERWIVMQSGGGGGNEIMFSIDGVYGVQEAASDHCDDQLRDAKSSYTATCLRKACSMGAVPGADENDKIVVHDYLGFLEDREEADVIGKTGLASFMIDCHGDYEAECKWIITWIDWFRTVQVITGVRMSETELCFDRKNVQVWDDCELDPICIPLTDCVDDYS